MLFTLQLEQSLDNLVQMGPDCPAKSIRNFMMSSLQRYDGEVIKLYENEPNTANLILKFNDKDDADMFFEQFHEKVAPRMWLNKSSTNKQIKNL